MKFMQQLLIILLFSALGELLQALIPLPVPAAIYGIVLLLVALCTGLLKADRIRQTAEFLLKIMPLLFVAPAVKLMEYWGLIAPDVGAILLIVAVTTVLVFGISGLVTKVLLRKEGVTDHE